MQLETGGRDSGMVSRQGARYALVPDKLALSLSHSLLKLAV
jgi:hypothetical protein